MLNQKEMGQRLRELRVKNTMTLFDMGEVLGLSYESVRRYEYGDKLPSIHTIIEYSEIFGVTSDYILKGII